MPALSGEVQFGPSGQQTALQAHFPFRLYSDVALSEKVVSGVSGLCNTVLTRSIILIFDNYGAPLRFPYELIIIFHLDKTMDQPVA